MGATFNVVEFDGNLSREELNRQYRNLVEEQRFEYGHGGYSGTFATLDSGIAVHPTTFPSRKEAEDHIEKTHQKRDTAIAVRFQDFKREINKRPTVDGRPISCGGTWSSGEANPLEIRYYYPDENHRDDRPYLYQTKTVAEVYDNATGRNKVLVADQLNDADREKVRDAWDAYSAAGKAWKELNDRMGALSKKLNKVEEDFTGEDWKELKAVRRTLKKSLELREKTKKKFIALDTKLGERLFKWTDKDNGAKWLVGGWCAS